MKPISTSARIAIPWAARVPSPKLSAPASALKPGSPPRLESAIANAEHNEGADIDELKVTTILVDEGSTLKRFTARAKGRGNKILKPTCHITVTVGD